MMPIKKQSTLVVTFCLLIWGTSSLAQDSQFSNESTHVDAIDNNTYWTPERLQSAKPLNLPKSTPSKTQSGAKSGQSSGKRVISSGHPPTLPIAPKENLLFEPLNSTPQPGSELPVSANKIAQRSQGRSNAYFTSSRVIPAPAAQNYYPYSATGKLFFSDSAGKSYICSGTAIQPRLVITAGHCVYDAETKTWHTNFLFVPAYHYGNAPFGWWDWSWATTTTAWINSRGKVPNKGDFAILEIQNNSLGQKIGDVIGWHGFFTYSANPNHLTLLGYPANFDEGEWLHRVDSQKFGNTSSNTVEYGSDMGGGSSGGPWLENFGEISDGQSLNPSGANYVVAVTSYGPNKKLGYQGASILDSTFSNGSTGIFEKACSHQLGNCR